LDAGWTLRRPGALFDRFHRRVLFPIRDAAGEVAGVIGRDVTDHARCKYVNMPRTAAYCKGRLLYQPAVADESACAAVIVCEGPLDALAVTAAATTVARDVGIRAVATCGTALTDDHARQIASTSPRDVIVCADADSAGVTAAAKWRATLGAYGMTPRVVALPDGHDPASWLAQQGSSGIDALLADAPGPDVASATQHPSFRPDGGMTA
jgi:DNA primase